MLVSSDIIRGYVDIIILSQLMRGDSYGYEINKTVRQLTGGRFELKEATLYTAFKRLEDSNYIRSYWGSNDGGARRRYYQITAYGRNEYRVQMESYLETREILDLLLGNGGEVYA